MKVMLFIPSHPISLYWEGTLSHMDSQFLYTGAVTRQRQKPEIIYIYVWVFASCGDGADL